MQCISVDLPDPDGPITAVNRPRWNSTLTPSSARTATSPLPYVLTRSTARAAGESSRSEVRVIAASSELVSMNVKLRPGRRFVIGARDEPERPPVGGGRRGRASTRRPMTHARTRPIVCRVDGQRIRQWFRRSWFAYGYEGEGTAPLEAIAWRLFGVVVLVAFVAITFAIKPHPGLTGRGSPVLASFIFPSRARSRRIRSARTCRSDNRILALLGVIVAAGALGGLQPHGVWVLGPYYVAIVAALNLDRRAAWLVFACRDPAVPGRIHGQGAVRRRWDVPVRNPPMVLRHAAAALRRRAA